MNTPDTRPWEPLNGRPPRVGDEVRQEWYGVTRSGTVGRVDGNGDPWTSEGGYIGPILGGTWYTRPAADSRQAAPPVTGPTPLRRILAILNRPPLHRRRPRPQLSPGYGSVSYQDGWIEPGTMTARQIAETDDD